MNKIFFNTTQLQSKIGNVLTAVQENGSVEITNRSRPNMVLMLKDSHDVMVKTATEQNEKIRQLTELIKAQG